MRLATFFQIASLVGVGACLAGRPAWAQTPAPAAGDSSAGSTAGSTVGSTPASPAAPAAGTKHNAAATKPAPMEGLAAKPVLVLPAQYVSFTDTLGWSKQLPSSADWLARLDTVLTAAFRERGLQTWRFADDITRSAKRNAGFVADPHGVAAISLRFGRRPPQYELGEPLASQLRSLIALNDARVVMIPVELRTVNRGTGGALVLRLALIDARGSSVLWIGDIPGAPSATWSDTLLTDLADQIGSLVVPVN